MHKKKLQFDPGMSTENKDSLLGHAYEMYSLLLRRKKARIAVKLAQINKIEDTEDLRNALWDIMEIAMDVSVIMSSYPRDCSEKGCECGRSSQEFYDDNDMHEVGWGYYVDGAINSYRAYIENAPKNAEEMEQVCQKALESLARDLKKIWINCSCIVRRKHEAQYSPAQ